MLVEAVRGALYVAAPLPDGRPQAEPIRAFTSPVFRERNRAARFARRLAGHECWGYRVGGEVASYFWLTRGPASVPLWRDVRLLVPQGVLYVWDCRTWAPHRRQGWYARSLEDARRIAAPRDVWIACDDANAASVSVIRRQFTPLKRYRFARLGPLHWTGAGFGRIFSA